jgi:hypothetical protein
MTQEVTEPVPRDRPSSVNPDATKQSDASSLTAACTAYVVVLITPRGKYLRRVFLSLHSAEQAMRRAHDRGQPAHLVLCRLTPMIVADLGEVAE